MRQKLTLVTLGVDDFERSMKFYEGLGWERSAASMDDMGLFPLGGMVLCLYPIHLLAKDAGMPEKGRGFSGMTLSYNARDEKEVDRVLEEVSKLGGTIIKPAQKAFWGGYHGYFRDPDGYVFEVAFNPFWQMDENDNLKL